jgi:hypothetical protein
MEVVLRRPSLFRFAPVLLALIVCGSPLLAQDQASPSPDHPDRLRFAVTDLGSLQGAPFSMAVGLNDFGIVAGASLLPDESAQHAVLWHRGQIVDIGGPGLGGPNSAAYSVNVREQVSGAAETEDVDPNGEDFCGYGTHLICRAFVWKDGAASTLPTLGGNNSEAGEINDRGVVAGNAENATVDSTCPSPKIQVLQEKPVVWENGKIRELPTRSGDPDGWTFGINDRDQWLALLDYAQRSTKIQVSTYCLVMRCYGIKASSLSWRVSVGQARSGRETLDSKSTTGDKWLARRLCEGIPISTRPCGTGAEFLTT